VFWIGPVRKEEAWKRESDIYFGLRAGSRLKGIDVGRSYFGKWLRKPCRWNVVRSGWLWGVRATKES
jgi:hypothetical protein